MKNIWHDIDEKWIRPDDFTAVIEIPKGGKNKYELDKETGLLRLAREVRGVRSLGSVALELCALAAGEADLFVTLRSCPWDHNAGRIILAEAGGSLCDLEGEFLPLDRRTPVLAANAPETLRLVRERYLGAAE